MGFTKEDILFAKENEALGSKISQYIVEPFVKKNMVGRSLDEQHENIIFILTLVILKFHKTVEALYPVDFYITYADYIIEVLNTETILHSLTEILKNKHLSDSVKAAKIQPAVKQCLQASLKKLDSIIKAMETTSPMTSSSSASSSSSSASSSSYSHSTPVVIQLMKFIVDKFGSSKRFPKDRMAKFALCIEQAISNLGITEINLPEQSEKELNYLLAYEFTSNSFDFSLTTHNIMTFLSHIQPYLLKTDFEKRIGMSSHEVVEKAIDTYKTILKRHGFTHSLGIAECKRATWSYLKIALDKIIEPLIEDLYHSLTDSGKRSSRMKLCYYTIGLLTAIRRHPIPLSIIENHIDKLFSPSPLMALPEKYFWALETECKHIYLEQVTYRLMPFTFDLMYAWMKTFSEQVSEEDEQYYHYSHLVQLTYGGSSTELKNYFDDKKDNINLQHDVFRQMPLLDWAIVRNKCEIFAIILANMKPTKLNQFDETPIQFKQQWNWYYKKPIIDQLNRISQSIEFQMKITPTSTSRFFQTSRSTSETTVPALSVTTSSAMRQSK